MLIFLLSLLILLSLLGIVQAATGPSQNPLSNEHTGVSGFGSKSRKKTIFLSPEDTSLNATANAIQSGTPQNIYRTYNGVDSLMNNFTSPNNTDLTDRPRLWVHTSKDPDMLWIQTRPKDQPRQTLRISMSADTGEWQVEESATAPAITKWVPIEGIYGIYQVPSGVLWALISKTDPILSAPKLGDNSSWWKIRKVNNLELVHMSRPNTLLSSAHLKEEVRQLRLLRKSLKQHDLYFCPDGSSVVPDMTKNLQQSFDECLQSSSSSSSNEATWWQSQDRRPDSRFFWNQASVDPLLERYQTTNSGTLERRLTDKLLQYVIPVTSAFVGIQSNLTAGDDEIPGLMVYHEILISRRSRYRAGTRFTKRGADASGAVANYAETEQVCLVVDESNTLQQCTSHVQTRGSIPLRWSSPTDIKTYRPRIRIGTDPLAQARALRLHLVEQHSYYATNYPSRNPDIAQVVFINLIDKHSDQGRLGRTFDEVLNAVMEVHTSNLSSTNETAKVVLVPQNNESVSECPLTAKSIQHVWYDFHAEVKGGKYDKLRALLKQTQPSLVDHGYLFAEAPTKDSGWNIRRRQNGVVRTNCMDCLDRTNVVQSIFGRFILFQQLSTVASCMQDTNKSTKNTWGTHATAFKKNIMALPWSKGEVAHRLLWADNADAISRLYAGTPALKGDFTRTGKRTKKGALDDGMNSLQRYYLNNFMDADRQEGMDLMVGYANFTNIESFILDDNHVDEDEGATSTEQGAFYSRTIQEAARQSYFGNILEGLSETHKKGLEKRLGHIDMTGTTVDKKRYSRRQLDLRWLPGDLQHHVISQARKDEDDASNSNESNGVKKEFCSQTALEAIDRRAATDEPWWVAFDDITSDGEEVQPQEDDGGDSSNDEQEKEAAIPKTRGGVLHHPRITVTQMFVAMFLATKAPLTLGAAVVALLGFTFLPDVLEMDGML
jgi:hypothetical protein